MYEDEREIESVYVAADDNQGFWKVGSNGVTKIVIYSEPGQRDWVPWCAVYVGEEIKYRFDMAGMGIKYK